MNNFRPKIILVCLLFIQGVGAGCQYLRKAPEMKTYELSKAAFLEVELIAHEEDKPFGSYLAMNLHGPAYAPLRPLLEKDFHLKLKDRGEAHITVITPPEFEKSLALSTNIQNVTNMARQFNLQKISFKPICIGRGVKTIDGVQESTFYIVVDAPELRELRKRIKTLAAGSEFDPELFYPHITLGYTKRDLHYDDGVIKDEASCVGLIQVN